MTKALILLLAILAIGVVTSLPAGAYDPPLPDGLVYEATVERDADTCVLKHNLMDWVGRHWFQQESAGWRVGHWRIAYANYVRRPQFERYIDLRDEIDSNGHSDEWLYFADSYVQSLPTSVTSVFRFIDTKNARRDAFVWERSAPDRYGSLIYRGTREQAFNWKLADPTLTGVRLLGELQACIASLSAQEALAAVQKDIETEAEVQRTSATVTEAQIAGVGAILTAVNEGNNEIAELSAKIDALTAQLAALVALLTEAGIN